MQIAKQFKRTCTFPPPKKKNSITKIIIHTLMQEVLRSLARIASACARLCLRAQVLPFPDAAVAVAFTEERLAALVGGTVSCCARMRCTGKQRPGVQSLSIMCPLPRSSRPKIL